MGWIDVAIPGVIGLMLVVRPHSFFKPTADAATNAGRERKLRGIGFLLLGVAALYLLIKLAEGAMR